MSRKTIEVLFVLFALLVLLLPSCSKPPDEFKIGSILVLSGDGAEYGKEAQRGIDLSVDEINARGGINGKRIKIVYEDDGGNATQAVSAFQKLITTDKVPVVIGSMYSSNSLAIAPIAEQNKVVLFSPATSSPKLTTAGDYVFRNWPSDDFEASAIAKFVYDTLGLRKVAILAVQNDYGQGLETAFKKVFTESGGAITAQENYPKDATDYRTQLTKIERTKPQGLYLPGYYNEIGQILRQAKALRMTAEYISCVSFEDPKVLEIAGNAAEGVIYGVPAYDPNSPDPLVREFVARFEKKYGTKPGAFAAHAYDALRIVAMAIEKGGYISDGIKDALYNIRDFPGVTGSTTIDRNGDVVKPIKIRIVHGGKFTDY